MNSRIPRPVSPSTGQQRLAQADSMLPSSPLAKVQRNRDPRNTLMVPVFDTRSETVSQGPRVYRSADTRKESVPSIPGTMKIIVGPEPEPNNQRTWYLPKAKLSRYSDIFKSIIAADDTVSEVELPTISPNSFAEFVSFMHSNIYSINTQVAGYRGVRAHADSCLLAAKLEADEYWEAAMRKLYDLFLPLAKSRTSDAKQSLIRAGDIAYVCVNTTEENLRRVVTINSEPLTSDNPLNPQIKLTTDDGSSGAPPAPPKRGYHSHDVGAMKGLCTLFFDALASHWTRSDVIYLGTEGSPRGGGSNKNDVPGDSTTWRQVCDMYPDFHFHIAKTSDVQHWWRTSLLKNINTYLNPVGIQFVGGPGGESSGGAVVRKEAVDKIKIKVEEVEADEELEMEPATRRPRLTLRLEGSNGSTSGDGVHYLEQASSNAGGEGGKIEEGVDSDRSTVVDGESEGEEAAPQDAEGDQD